MNLRKIRGAEWTAAVGGVTLIVALFLPWYGTGGTGATIHAWQAFTVVDFMLLVCALFGVLLIVLQVQQATAAVPLSVAGLGSFAGLFAIAVVLIRGIVFPPGDGTTLEWGVFVALAAAVTLWVGCWRSIGDERIRLSDGRWSRPSDAPLPDGIEFKSAGPGASADAP